MSADAAVGRRSGHSVVGVRVRVLAPADLPAARDLLERAFARHRFYDPTIGLGESGMRAYWAALVDLVMDDPHAWAYGGEADGRLTGVLLFSRDGFPSLAGGLRLVARILCAAGPLQAARYLAFVANYERLMARPRDEQRREARGLWLVTDPTIAGVRVGSRIVREVVERLRREGVTILTLLVDGSDDRLILYYRRLGFDVVAERQFRGGPALRMELRTEPILC